jgi:hypothetical protein
LKIGLRGDYLDLRAREELVGGWRRQHIEELHNLYTPRIIIRVIKSRRMRYARRVDCTEDVRNA